MTRNSKTLILTGARGNLGTALQTLGKNHIWIGINRAEWKKLPKSGIDVVIHAASDLLTPVWKAPSSLIDSNLMSTVRLLENFPRGARLVFISSCAVYGRGEVTKEETDPTPISMNGITKYLNEVMIRDYCKQHQIDYQILRVFNTFGGNDRFSIVNQLQRALEAGRPFTLFNDGISQRDYIHVDDVARIVSTLVEKPIQFRTMNIGSGEATRTRDIVDAFRKKHPSLEVASSVREEAEYSRADISKLNETLPGLSFQPILDYIRGFL